MQRQGKIYNSAPFLTLELPVSSHAENRKWKLSVFHRYSYITGPQQKCLHCHPCQILWIHKSCWIPNITTKDVPRCASCQLFIKGLLSGPALTIISANVKGPSAVKQGIIIQLCDKCNCQALSLQAKHQGVNNSYHQDTKDEPDQRKNTWAK